MSVYVGGLCPLKHVLVICAPVLSQTHSNHSCLDASSCMSDILHVFVVRVSPAVIRATASVASTNIVLVIFCHMVSSSKRPFSVRLLRMWVVHVAVVAAHGGDELLHAVLGAAVAGRAWLVHQRGVLLARPHAHAGAPPAAFYSACLYHDVQTTVIQMRLWVCFMPFISACILQTHVVGEGLVHATIRATRLVGMISVPHQVQKTLLPFGHGCKHVWMWWLCTPAAFGAGDKGTYQLSAYYTSQRWDIQSPCQPVAPI